MRYVLAAAMIGATLSGPALAQTPVPMPAPIATPQDITFPGTITLAVDATDVQRGIFRVRETVPVAHAGPMTLLYPHWLPGDHSPTGQIDKLAGLRITANGQRVAWRRDVIDIAAFHLDVPAGAQSLELEFQFLSATNGDQGAVVTSPAALILEFNSMLLYPAGHYASRINFEPSVKLPEGWSYATALGNGTATSAPVQFAATDLNTLVDSPLFAGRYFNRINLDPNGRSPVYLNVVGDRADQVRATEAQIAPHRRLIRQIDRLFGARHFDHYDFLLAVSDRLDGMGLEHHRSSANATPGGYFTEWNDYIYERDLLPHEMVHSWNGKYRRPADLWTPNYNVPMRDTLLWVYEGQTQYWGEVLAARSGLWSRQDALDSLARIAAIYENFPGHTWRPTEDTTNDPVISERAPQGWNSWQRSEDYYSVGQLIWLDADTLIRQRTNGARSLDTFARSFFGSHDGQWNTVTYTFDDIVAALNAVMPYDWATFLHARLDEPMPHAPLDGIARAGYRVGYGETRSAYQTALETERKRSEFLFSVGFSTGEEGQVSQVVWDGPAFNQGLTRGDKIIAVNGQAYDGDVMRRAITAAKTDTHPLELLVQNGDHYRTLSIDYHDGLRYPRLERIPGTPDRLGAILAPR